MFINIEFLLDFHNFFQLNKYDLWDNENNLSQSGTVKNTLQWLKSKNEIRV